MRRMWLFLAAYVWEEFIKTLLHRGARHILSVEPKGPGCERVESSHHLHEGRLARQGRSQKDVDPARHQFQIRRIDMLISTYPFGNIDQFKSHTAAAD